MKNKAQPIIIHVLGQSGKVKDSHMGILVDGNIKIIDNVENFDELVRFIGNFQGANFGG
jgi:hypothetical protein